MKNIDKKTTIREYFEEYKECDDIAFFNSYDCIEFVGEEKIEQFNKVCKCTDGFVLSINEDDDGDLYVAGNESNYQKYFDDDTTLSEVFYYLYKEMYNEVERFFKEFDKTMYLYEDDDVETNIYCNEDNQSYNSIELFGEKFDFYDKYNVKYRNDYAKGEYMVITKKQ